MYFILLLKMPIVELQVLCIPGPVDAVNRSTDVFATISEEKCQKLSYLLGLAVATNGWICGLRFCAIQRQRSLKHGCLNQATMYPKKGQLQFIRQKWGEAN